MPVPASDGSLRVRRESQRLTLSGGHQIHITRLSVPGQRLQARWLVLPGLGHDSACWQQGPDPWVEQLARAGCEVWLADTRGKGLSLPKLSPQADWGLDSCVGEEVPAVLRALQAAGDDGLPWLCAAENLMGLVVLAALGQQPAYRHGLCGLLLLQVARPVLPQDGARFFWQWRVGRFGRIASRLAGEVHAPWCGFGELPEARRRYYDAVRWFCGAAWASACGTVDHAQQVQALALPPVLHLALAPDRRIPLASVRRFVQALPAHDARILVCAPQDLQDWQRGEGAGHAGNPARAVADWQAACLAAAQTLR